MKIGRIIGETVQRLPGIGSAVERIRAVMRSRRTARRNRRGGGPAGRYATWIRTVDTPSPADLAELGRRAAGLRSAHRFSLLMPVAAADPALLERAIVAVHAQVYPGWELHLVVAAGESAAVEAVIDRHGASGPRIRVHRAARGVSAAEARNTALAAATGDVVAVVGAADVLPPQALFWIADAFERHPQAQIVYADEDRIDAAGLRCDPWFKCDYNRELLLAQDAFSKPTAYRLDLARRLGGWRAEFAGAEDYDLTLRAVAASGGAAVVHVPLILCHRGDHAGDDASAAAARRRAVADALHRQGSAAEVLPAPEAPDCSRIRHPLPAEPPLVSIIVCTRDHERLLRVAVESIRSRTTYPRYELIVVDNGSVEPKAVAYLADLAGRPGVRVLRDDSPFNYSRLNNRAAATARGEVLCLLNDDIEVLTPDWLEEMVSFAVQPDVGAVGARLWYPDGTLQHGGVILGICNGAAHAHPRLRRGDRGYFGRAVLQQELSAVTAACLAVRAGLFAAVGGLDERLEVAFNDVDFCLRLRLMGHRNVWTPFAELVHHESASRGHNDTPAKRAREERELRFLRGRWGETLLRDPFYHPNLSHAVPDFSVDAPRRRRAA